MVMRMKRFLLTTVDNPYHPGDEYEQWRKFDLIHGYRTEERMARVQGTSASLTDAEEQRITNAIVDDFIRLDALAGSDLYKKVIVDE